MLGQLYCNYTNYIAVLKLMKCIQFSNIYPDKHFVIAWLNRETQALPFTFPEFLLSPIQVFPEYGMVRGLRRHCVYRHCWPMFATDTLALHTLLMKRCPCLFEPLRQVCTRVRLRPWSTHRPIVCPITSNYKRLMVT